ncbi:hypothetical protein A9A59_2234 [Tepidiforma thermophila]|uniref:Uncharacterized protein n=1 Tax=Tepidiforma thermophila (strain KCTC 52669 / CGMCC 1.13589 / G233) TaxID=2761530 RepID=A0A2A9HG23_TEPT2|nr:hypothetical protein A9A59_2234 [Tepidiforma thermophila]
MAAGGLAASVTLRPELPWLPWLTAVLVAFATDGIVRSHPGWTGGPLDSLVYTFLPALGIIGAALFIDHAIVGYARPALALVAALSVGAVAFGEYQTVDVRSRLYGPFRLVMAVATYLVAFSFYAVLFTRDDSLGVAALAVGAVSMLLALELLRESRITGPSSLLVALAIGISLAELRLALYFFPLDGLLAGALLVIAFYLATGIVHHLLDHDLEWGTAAEYAVVTTVASAAVIVARVFA